MPTRISPLALLLVALPLAFATLLPAQVGPCTPDQPCSIETRLTTGDLCAAPGDTIDNDGNSFTNAADVNCTSETMCQDGVDNDADGFVDGADSDCRCMGFLAGGEQNCTANDFSIAYNIAPDVSDGCINSSDTVTAQITATLSAGAAVRYDLGLWLALGEHSPNTASSTAVCTKRALTPLNFSYGGDSVVNGPFTNLDTDRCGDMDKNEVTSYTFPYDVRVPCTDVFIPTGGTAGYVDMRQCGSWVNPGQNTTCDNFSQLVPGTTSKCSCSSADTTIPAPNLRMQCDNFSGATSINTGQTATFQIDFTNDLSATTCTAASGPAPFGLPSCGTAGFIRVVVEYLTADDNGTFFLNDGVTPIATCPSANTTSTGLLCNDVAMDRLVWAPTTSPNNVPGVISPISGLLSLPFKYRLDTLAPVRFDTFFYWDQTLDTDIADGTISTAEAVTIGADSKKQDLDLLTNPDLSDYTCNTNISTTPITLSYFRATPAARGYEFDWSTETEVGNVGFNLYAVVDGERVQINDSLIPSKNPNSLEPIDYRVVLPVPDDAMEFVIEDIDLFGAPRAHGPFRTGKAHGARIETESVDWSRVRRANGLARGQDARDLGRTGRSLAKTGPVRAEGPGVVELLVDRSGLYRVTHEALLGAGFDFGAQQASQLQLSTAGTPVPIFVSTTGKFGPGSYLEFWGEALDTLYTTTNVYRLEAGQKRALRAGSSSAAPAGAVSPAYLETTRLERDRDYSYWASFPDPFYDTQMLVTTTPASWNFALSLDGYVAGAAPSTLRIGVYGGTSNVSINPDHHVQFFVNGAYIGDALFDGVSGVHFEGSIPENALVDGENVVTARLPTVPGSAIDLIQLDYVEIEYPRTYTPRNGRLAFSAQAGTFSIGPFASPDIVAYRLDGSAITRLEGLTREPDGASYRVAIPGSASPADYVVAETSALREPSSIRAARPAIDLTSGTTDYLILSHAAFLDGIGPLAAARQAEGYQVRIVDVEDVYAQFGHGIFDARAIQDYIAFAHSSLGTRYVLLVGGDTYDYRDALGYGAISFVPTLYRPTGDIIRFAPLDAALADVDGDGVQDLAIGRLPARTQDELDTMVRKTLEFDGAVHFRDGTFTADLNDPRANEPFVATSNAFVGRLSDGWSIDRIHVDQTGTPGARSRLFERIATGTRLLSYVGHSGLSSWGSPDSSGLRLFTVGDVPQLDNGGNPLAVTQFGCWSLYFSSPRTESVGSRLIREPDRGAAVVMGAISLTEHAHSGRFGRLFLPILSRPGTTVGDAIVEAKRALAATATPSDDLRDVLLGWTLLGDPAAKVDP